MQTLEHYAMVASALADWAIISTALTLACLALLICIFCGWDLLKIRLRQWRRQHLPRNRFRSETKTKSGEDV